MLLLILLFGVLNADSTEQDKQLTYLEKFFNETEGDSWSKAFPINDKDNLKKSQLIEWDDGVLKINLTNNNVEGSVPDFTGSSLVKLTQLQLPLNKITKLPDMTALSSLETLNASYNSIESVGLFPGSLKVLLLNNNSLNGTVDALLEKLSDRGTIEVININGNKLSGNLEKEELLSDNDIKEFRAAYNYISGSLDDSNIKKSWTALDLRFNNISGTYPATLAKVENIFLQCNKFDCTSVLNGYNVRECMCSQRGFYAVVNTADTSIECKSCEDGKMANKWVRFSADNDYSDLYACEGPSEGCISCMFPANCKAGTCITGSEGATCERCSDNYRMIAGTCQPCLDIKVPVAALLMLVFVIIIIGYGIFLAGLNRLSCTMIKQLMTYLQIYCLTMDIKASWPKYLGEVGDAFKVSMLNTQAFDLECLTDLSTLDIFYVNWTCSVTTLLVCIAIFGLLTKSLNRRIEGKKKAKSIPPITEDLNHLHLQQQGTRRIFVMFMIILFVPITKLSIITFACDYWIWNTVTLKWNDGSKMIQNQWLYDNSISCYDYTFQGVNFIATLFCVFEFGVIVFLFLLLFRLWKFDLKDRSNELFGTLYESFNDKGLFCEPFLLLRKFILILTTQVTYISSVISGAINISFSLLWLLGVLILQPYIHVGESGQEMFLVNNWCNLFEIAATTLIILTQSYAIWHGAKSVTDVNKEIFDYIVVSFHILLVLVWIAGFIVVMIKWTKSGLKRNKTLRSARSTVRKNPMLQLSTVTPETMEAALSDESVPPQ